MLAGMGWRRSFYLLALLSACAREPAGDTEAVPPSLPAPGVAEPWTTPESNPESNPVATTQAGDGVDTDQDRIPDAEDQCPEMPEDYDGYLDEDGCPEMCNPPGCLRSPHWAVHFDDRGEIDRESRAHLDELVTTLEAHPEVRIRVAGHADSEGEAARNQTLSEARARRVADYLVDQGITRDRLEVEGHGEARPIDSNRSPEGRARNRRVEVFVIDRDCWPES